MVIKHRGNVAQYFLLRAFSDKAAISHGSSVFFLALLGKRLRDNFLINPPPML
jgi:hypothetical protein